MTFSPGSTVKATRGTALGDARAHIVPGDRGTVLVMREAYAALPTPSLTKLRLGQCIDQQAKVVGA